MIIYFVRHAEPKISIGLSDKEKESIGLSQYGLMQARAVGSFLKKIKPEKIFSSPIERAKQTAEIISLATKLPFTTDQRLREFFTDPNLKDSLAQKESKRRAKAHPSELFPSGESFDMAVERVEKFIIELENQGFKKVCLVGHRMVFEGLLAKNFNTRVGEAEWMNPASVTSLEFEGGVWKVLLFCNKRKFSAELLFETLIRKVKFMLEGFYKK